MSDRIDTTQPAPESTVRVIIQPHEAIPPVADRRSVRPAPIPADYIKHPNWCQSAHPPYGHQVHFMLTGEGPAEESGDHVGRQMQLDTSTFDWSVRVAPVQAFEPAFSGGEHLEHAPAIRLTVEDHAGSATEASAHLTAEEAQRLVAMLQRGILSLECGVS